MTTKSKLDTALKTLLKKLTKSVGVQTPHAQWDDPIEEFIWSFLLWDSTTAKAENALKRIRAGVFDYNELRVSLPGEIVALIGKRYPNAPERAVRLRAALDDIFRKENAVSLACLNQLTKREAKKALEAIDAAPSFVTNRVLLLSLGGHAVPLDERLHRLLIDADVLEPDTSLDDASAQLGRHIKAANAAQTHLLLQAWSEASVGAKPTKKTAPKKKTTAKKTTVQKTSPSRAATHTTRKKTTKKPAEKKQSRAKAKK